jgi:hypothetical protein
MAGQLYTVTSAVCTHVLYDLTGLPPGSTVVSTDVHEAALIATHVCACRQQQVVALEFSTSMKRFD